MFNAGQENITLWFIWRDTVRFFAFG